MLDVADDGEAGIAGLIVLMDTEASTSAVPASLSWLLELVQALLAAERVLPGGVTILTSGAVATKELSRCSRYCRASGICAHGANGGSGSGAATD